MANGTVQKKKTNNRNKAKVKSNRTEHREILSLVLFSAGLLMFLSFINKVGPVGHVVKMVMFGMFGQVVSFLMIGLVWFLAWCFLRGTEKEVFTFKKCFLFGLFLLLISALIHTMSFNASQEDFFTTVRNLISSYTEKKLTGGLFGGGISLLLQKYMEKVGALVVLFPSTIIIAMILFSLSLMNFVNRVIHIGEKAGKSFGKMYKRLRDNKQAKVKVPNKQQIKSAIEESETIVNDYYEEESLPVKTKPQPQVSTPVHVEEEPETEVESEPVFEIYEKNTNKPAEAITSKEKYDYIKPPFSLLSERPQTNEFTEEQKKQATRVAKKLEEVLQSFGIDAKVIHISRGPTITRYEVKPNSGVKVSKIKNLSEDIALNLASPGIRIEQIDGKAAIGIEIPNESVQIVTLREIIESKTFLNHKSKTAFCLGCDISGEPMVADIARMPHMLIAGATGAGKSVCINSLIMSLIYKASPSEVKLILIDPKVVELGVYNGIPHLLIPVVTQPKKAAGALAWAVQEMENRYALFAQKGTRDISGYNSIAEAEELEKLPKIIIIIDELADLMLVARDSVEDAICRIAQKARAAGIHLVIATQRPSVDVITGLIKANIPSRIAFKVASQVDSRIILDNLNTSGADKLLGRGDMLFMPVGSMKPTRIQGAFVSDTEVENVVEYLKREGQEDYDMSVLKEVESVNGDPANAGAKSDEDELLMEAVQIAIEMKQISASYLQRKLSIGYNRAARIIDQMQERGYVSSKDGSNPRMVLIDKLPE